MKTFSKLVIAILILATSSLAQQGRIYQDAGGWAQEITGSVGEARNLHVRVDAGSVRVEGGSQAGISYRLLRRVHSSSEEKARREFEGSRINAYVRNGTAW